MADPIYATQAQIDNLYNAIMHLSDSVRDALVSTNIKYTASGEAITSIRRELDRMESVLSTMVDDKRLDDVRDQLIGLKEFIDRKMERQEERLHDQDLGMETLRVDLQQFKLELGDEVTRSIRGFGNILTAIKTDHENLRRSHEDHLDSHATKWGPALERLKEWKWKITGIFTAITGLGALILWGVKTGIIPKIFKIMSATP